MSDSRSEVLGFDSPYDLCEFLQPKYDAECGLSYKYNESITKKTTINSISKALAQKPSQNIVIFQWQQFSVRTRGSIWKVVLTALIGMYLLILVILLMLNLQNYFPCIYIVLDISNKNKTLYIFNSLSTTESSNQ